MKTMRATLAISAILFAGLVVAGHVRYPSDAASEAAVRQAMADRLEQIAAETRAAEAKAAATKAAWVDPPAQAADPAKIAWTAAPARETDATPAPQPVAAQPERRQTLTSEAAKKAEQARRRKLAQAARAKQVKDKEAAGTADVAYQNPQAAPAQRIDPIGDILRGLGIGRQG